MFSQINNYAVTATLCLTLVISTLLPLANAETFTAGDDYKVMKTPVAQTHTKQVNVIEFFSYGCPWCYRLEKSVSAWVSTQPKYIHFQRVPVTFEPGWDNYAKAYYVAKAMGIEATITASMFKAIHDKHLRIKTPEQMQAFFVKRGADPTEFTNLFHYNPSIDIQVARAPKTMEAYRVFSVPTFVVAGKYKTDASMAKGDNNRLIAILNYLTKKAHQEQQS